MRVGVRRRLGRPPADFFTRDWGDGFVAGSSVAASSHLPRITAAQIDGVRNRLGHVRARLPADPA
jgi:hypothetical protein